MKMKKTVLVLLTASSLVSCATGPNTQTGAVLGALVGAGVGGIIGNQSGRGLEGAAIGAAAGGLGGAALGNARDTSNRQQPYQQAGYNQQPYQPAGYNQQPYQQPAPRGYYDRYGRWVPTP